jgi:hypothetical protein
LAEFLPEGLIALPFVSAILSPSSINAGLISGNYKGLKLFSFVRRVAVRGFLKAANSAPAMSLIAKGGAE